MTDAAYARWLATFRELVRVPSTFEHEHAAVAVVEDTLRELGVDVERVAHDADVLRGLAAAQPPFSDVAGRHSVVARIPGRGGGRSLVFNSHLDGVPAGDASSWEHDPFAGHVDEGNNVIHGRGAMDDKAGVALALAVADTLLRGPRLAGDVIFHFVLEDETTGNGTLLCLEAGHAGDGALILDGTRPDRAIYAHAGNVQVRLTVHGAAASVSVSHVGVNAADELARLLAQLRDRVHALNDRLEEPWSQFPSPYQFVTQTFHADGGPLTVPDRAEATAWITFPPPHDVASMRALLEDETVVFGGDAQLDFGGFSAEPAEAQAEPLLSELREAAAANGFGEIAAAPSTGTSDLRHFAARGIPCLLYGPGRGYNPHRANEHYLLDDFAPMLGVYVALAERWCA